MNAKLQECLTIVEEICCDVEERYPVGLLRVRHLLREVVAAEVPDDGEMMYLGADPLEMEPPSPAA